VTKALTLKRWADAPYSVYDVLGPYLDVAWLPILGPTSTLLLRRLATDVRSGVEAFDLDDLAAGLGVGRGPGRHHGGSQNAPVQSSLRRLDQFGLVRLEIDALAVRDRLPKLSRGQLDRLPPAVVRRVIICDDLLRSTIKEGAL